MGLQNHTLAVAAVWVSGAGEGVCVCVTGGLQVNIRVPKVLAVPTVAIPSPLLFSSE